MSQNNSDGATSAGSATSTRDVRNSLYGVYHNLPVEEGGRPSDNGQEADPEGPISDDATSNPEAKAGEEDGITASDVGLEDEEATISESVKKEPEADEADPEEEYEEVVQYLDEDGNLVDEHGNPLEEGGETGVVEEVEEDPSSEWFIEAETGTKYRDLHETKRGIEEKDRYIHALESQVDQLSPYKETARMYENLLDPEQLVNLAVKAKLPDEFKDVKEDEIEDADTLRRYAHAIERAKYEVEKEQESAAKRSEDAQREFEQSYKTGVDFIREQLVEKNIFDVRNVEQRFALGKFLDEKPSEEGMSRLDVAHHLVMTAGTDRALEYLKGLTASYWGDREDKVVRKVRKIVKRVKPAKVAVSRTKEQGTKPNKKQDRLADTAANRLRAMYSDDSMRPQTRKRRKPSFGQR